MRQGDSIVNADRAQGSLKSETKTFDAFMYSCDASESHCFDRSAGISKSQHSRDMGSTSKSGELGRYVAIRICCN